jgi:hypothetical protein
MNCISFSDGDGLSVTSQATSVVPVKEFFVIKMCFAKPYL